MSGICPTRLTSHRTSWQTGKKYLFQGLYDSEKHLVKLLLAETQKVVEKTQIEFNKELHEKYPDSFREEKLLIEQRNGKIKKQLETKRVRNWIKFKSNKHIGCSNTRKKSTHFLSPKRKEGNVPSKDIVFFNDDQSKDITIKREFEITDR